MTDLQITSTIQTITVDGGENVIAVYPNFAPRSSDFDFATRAEAVAMLTALLDLADGRTFQAAGLSYIRKAGATEIPDMPGFVPNGTATPGHYGAVGDGVADDKAAIDAAAAANDEVSVYGPTLYNASSAAINGRYVGPDQITSNDGKRGRYFSAIKSAKTHASEDSVLTAFNGDISGIQFPVEHRVTGAATLGQPATGYLYSHEATPHYTYMFNSSGHNEELDGNEGRTGLAAYRTLVYQAGQGDAVAYNAGVTIASVKAGATGNSGWLASPAGAILNGNIQSVVDGAYLNPYEVAHSDNGFAVACVGAVYNLKRTNSGSAIGQGWDGARYQSTGTQPIDAAVRILGPTKVGLNLVEMTNGNAAVAMAAGQRIYLDAAPTGAGHLFNTTLNDTYISATGVGGGVHVVVNNNAVLQLASASSGTSNVLSAMSVFPGVDAAGTFRVYGAATGAAPYAAIGTAGTTSFVVAATDGTDNTTLAFRTALAGAERNVLTLDPNGNANLAVVGAVIQVEGTRVINARKTGWATDTGTAKRTANVTYSGTAEAVYTQATIQSLMDATRDLSQTIKALKDDLHATAGHGLIGA